jgi:hypothetical protein
VFCASIKIHAFRAGALQCLKQQLAPFEIVVEKRGKAFAALTADQANETASMTDIFIFMSFASVRQHGCARKSNDRESQRNLGILHCPDAAVPVENVPFCHSA